MSWTPKTPYLTTDVEIYNAAEKLLIGADDAKEAMIVNLDDLEPNKLVFDHGNILDDYLKKYHKDSK